MRLLICTQTLDSNDPILGFFHRWVEEFSKYFESIIVVCLKEGEHHLPSNVRVLSLGKEHGSSRLVRIIRFFSYIYKHQSEYDAVFVHMNPEYVVLGGFFWRIWHKRVALWYVHKSVTLRLRIAVRLVHIVFTASKESFRLSTHKLRIIGHGIDTAAFKPDIPQSGVGLRIITVGRISPSKRLQEMLFVLDILHARKVHFRFTIVGTPTNDPEQAYVRLLQKEVARRPYTSAVEFAGAISQEKLPSLLNKEDIFINLSLTGSLDKAVLEALACGVPVVTTNEAFKSLIAPGLYVCPSEPHAIAEKIISVKDVNRASLHSYMREHYSLERLIPTIEKAYH
ncbi:glycosyltransferase [Acetobacteraceae bacterium]|nr:glycosyltransferase [Candidatus Parcubacteria bacterium]